MMVITTEPWRRAGDDTTSIVFAWEQDGKTHRVEEVIGLHESPLHVSSKLMVMAKLMRELAGAPRPDKATHEG